MKWRALIIISVLAFSWAGADAQIPLKGGEISLQRGTIYQYFAKVCLLVNWPSTVNKPYIHVDWGDGNAMDSIPYSYMDCGMDSSVALIYTTYHTYPAGGNYTVTVVDSFFVPGILNIPNSGSQKITFHQELTTQMWDSPSEPMAAGCLSGGVACYPVLCYDDNGEHDVDGDSVGFSLIPHQDIPGYVMPPASINLNGLITFSTNVPQGLYNVFVKIDEWRKLPPAGTYSIIGTSYEDWIFRVLCSNSVGLIGEEQTLQEFRVYPNPTSGKFRMECPLVPGDALLLSVLNSLGQEVYSIKNAARLQEIDLSVFPNGMYFLKVANGCSQKLFKIVKD